MKNIKSYKKSTLLFVAISGVFAFNTAIAQDLCSDSGAIMKAAKKSQEERVEEINEHAKNVYRQLAMTPDWLSNANSLLSNCVADKFDDWKIYTGSAIFDSIINKAKDAAIDKACAEQRKRVSEFVAKNNNYISKIRGYEKIGVGMINFPEGSGNISYDDLIGKIGGNIGGGNGAMPTLPTFPGTGIRPTIPGNPGNGVNPGNGYTMPGFRTPEPPSNSDGNGGRRVQNQGGLPGINQRETQ